METKEITNQEIIYALRCSSSVQTDHMHCETCPFRVIEHLGEVDAALFGCEEWETCDVDRIGIVAADRLQALLAENERLKAHIPKWEAWKNMRKGGEGRWQ